MVSDTDITNGLVVPDASIQLVPASTEQLYFVIPLTPGYDGVVKFIVSVVPERDALKMDGFDAFNS